MYNGEFNQCLEVIIKAKTHEECLQAAKAIKKQCEAWDFCIRYDEHKSAQKGDVLSKDILIYQTAYAGDILTFKEAIRRLCQHYEIFHKNVTFIDRGTEPVNSMRQDAHNK